MKLLQLTLVFNEELGLKKIAFDINETGLPCNSDLLQKVALVLLKAVHINSDSMAVQDLLNELDIKVEK